MRTAAFITIFICSFSIGLFKSYSYRKRKEILEDFVLFMDRAYFMLSQRHSDIFEIINESDFILFENTSLNVYNFKDYYENAKEQNLIKMFLEKEDIECFDNLFYNFGKGDLESQSALIKSVKSKIETNLEQAEENIKKYGKAYTVFGALTGISLIILLI